MVDTEDAAINRIRPSDIKDFEIVEEGLELENI
jgi:hypothetical protein